MAKRAPIVIAATIVGTVAVLLAKPLEPAGTLASGAGPAGPSSGGAADGGSADGASSSSAGSGAGSSSSSSSGSSSSSTGGSSSSKARSGTVMGSAVETRFGTVQVRATIASGRLAAVTAVQLPNGDPRSFSISRVAEPYLHQEVLTKQGAKVDVISGATYTSYGYMASLQSALDTAGYAAPDGSKAGLTVPDEQGGGFFHH